MPKKAISSTLSALLTKYSCIQQQYIQLHLLGSEINRKSKKIHTNHKINIVRLKTGFESKTKERQPTAK